MIEVIPTVAVEVTSPTDGESHIAGKLALYLAAGVREVWWVRPDDRQVSIHRRDGAPFVFSGDAVLVSPDILPGFSLPAELFADIEEA